MPHIKANGLDIFYDEFGDPNAPALLLIMGLGTQMVAWPESFCRDLAGQGFRVIRFDNRDIGLSQKMEGSPRYSVPFAMFKSWLGLKVRSPYTQMYLTHIDEDGRDSPAILIDNSTASNRAVNIPEFVNIPPDGLLNIDIPAVEFYRVFDRAWDLTQKGQDEAAITEWKNALSMSPEDDKSHSNLGAVLLRQGRLDEAVTHFEKALAIKPDSAGGYNNLGVVLLQKGRLREAAQYFDKALGLNPAFAEAHFNMASVYYLSGRIPQALEHWRKGLALEPRPSVMIQVAWVLSTSPEPSVRNGKEAIRLAERALELSNQKAPETLDTLAAAYAEAGRFADAIETIGKAQALAAEQHKSELAAAIKTRAGLYAAKSAFREEQRR